MEKENRRELEKSRSDLEEMKKQVAEYSESLNILLDEEIEKTRENEESGLKESVKIVLYTLSACIIIPSVIIGIDSQIKFLSVLNICLLGGVIGSSVSALISALERKANGWGFENGLKYPKDSSKEKKEMYSIRMSSFFLFRPLLGLLAGLIIYYGFHIVGDERSPGNSSEATIIFWSILAGLFAKTLIAKLKDIFKNIIGK